MLSCTSVDALWSPARKRLTSWLSFVLLSLSHWYPGSCVVLNCIGSWSLPYFLLSYRRTSRRQILRHLPPFLTCFISNAPEEAWGLLCLLWCRLQVKLKKRQNLKLSSAADYKWRFKCFLFASLFLVAL